MTTPSAIYGNFQYGQSYYGYLAGFPVSDDFRIFDFCYPVDAVMGLLFAYPEVSAPRFGLPWNWFDPSYNFCMFSDDGAESGFRIDLSVPQPYCTIQFSIEPVSLPQNFSDLANSCVFVGVFNQFGKMGGLLVSENEGLALAQSGVGPYIVLPDSADIFDEGDGPYVFRFTINESTGKGNLYVTRKDVLTATGVHQLRYTFSLLACPAGETDNFRVEVRGTASDPTEIHLGCIRMDDREKIPNQRPVAVPGPDKTQIVGNYVAFDGRESYDPEGQPLKFWWSLVEVPDGSAYRARVAGDTPADPTGYTNVVLCPSGPPPVPFTDILEGDIFVNEDGFSTIMYVASDGSYFVLADDLLNAGTTVEGYVAKQIVWGGTRRPTTVQDVLDVENTPPLLPADGDTYLVDTAPVGLWAGQAGYLATWSSSGGVWLFSLPAFDTIIYAIGKFECFRHAGAGIWYEAAPKGWELDHWEGRTDQIGVMLVDTLRLFVVELLVNDGELDSLPAEVLCNSYETNVQLGLTPDLSFIWNYISDFWKIVEGREKAETVWSGLAQVYTDLLMRLWQYDYAKSILDIQRLFQVRWIDYSLVYEEPNYDELPATIESSVDASGFSVAPGVTERAFDLGAVVADVSDLNYLVLDSIPYKVIRVEQGATTVVITSDPMPHDDAIAVWVTPPESQVPPLAPSDGDAYMVGIGGTDAWVGRDGEIATWNEDDSLWDFSESVRPKAWMIRASVVSRFSNFSDLRVSPGDTATFEVRLDGDVTDVTCYVYAVRGSAMIFDQTNISAYLADDSYTVRFKSVLRQSEMQVNDLVKTIPRLQDTIAIIRVPGASAPLLEYRDFRVEKITTIEDREVNTIQFDNLWFPFDLRGFAGYTTAPDHHYFYDNTVDFEATFGAGADLRDYVIEIDGGSVHRLWSVVGPTQVQLYDPELLLGLSGKKWWIRRREVPPATLWAEITFLDNSSLIEANFGRLVGLGIDKLEERTYNPLDYLSAVQGLWYFKWHGRTPYNIRVGSQIILGLPFSEKAGTVVDIQDPFDATRTRILVQDSDSEFVVRSYYLPTVVGIETNPETGLAYAPGDSVSRFAPLSKGVDVVDYISDPDWFGPFVGSEDFHEVQKVHTFGVLVEADAYSLTNLMFLIDYIRGSWERDVVQNKPPYTWPLFAVIKRIHDTVDVADPLQFGPLPPPSPYVYPLDWPPFPVMSTWDDSPYEVTRVSGALYGADKKFTVPPLLPADTPHKTRYEVIAPATGVFVGQEGNIAIWNADTDTWSFHPAIPGEPQRTEFGGLHLSDTPAKVPDGWQGAWSTGEPGTHYPTRAEGTFKVDERNEKGHIIHHVDEPLLATTRLLDGDMEDGINPGIGRPWKVFGTPSICAKVTVAGGHPVHAGTYSTRIKSTDPYEGIYQSFVLSAPGVVPTGFQIGARGWLYVVDGCALIRLLDQDGVTVLAEQKRNFPSMQWIQFTVHAWEVGDGSPLLPVPPQLRILTGPAGGEFYVDDVVAYHTIMPWSQWGADRSIMGRTGGYTFGGSPDEFWAFKMYSPLP